MIHIHHFTCIFLSLSLATTARAFVSPVSRRVAFQSPQTTGLLATPATKAASAAIAEAMRVSKQYGIHSPEAAVAWDAVEEINAADNSNAFDIPSLDTECLVEEEISQACLDYGDKLDQLSSLLQDTKPQLHTLKTVASDMAAIKLKVNNNQRQSAPDSPELRQALAHAKRVSQQTGTTSPEAKLAWEAVEEIASAGLENSLGGRLELDQECLVESALDACLALEELNRALTQMKQQQNQ